MPHLSVANLSCHRESLTPPDSQVSGETVPTQSTSPPLARKGLEYSWGLETNDGNKLDKTNCCIWQRHIGAICTVAAAVAFDIARYVSRTYVIKQ